MVVRQIAQSSIFGATCANRSLAMRTEMTSCIPGPSDDCLVAIKLLEIIAEAKHYDGMALIGHINRSINSLIRPAPGRWVSAFEAIKLGSGDCKSYAIAKYFALREAGIAPARVRLVIVHNPQSGQGQDHMIAAVYLDDRWLILDNLTLTLITDSEAKNYIPLGIR
jgi:predicted transglutaminase-like cysteine proteinase